MLGMSGFEVTHEIRKIKNIPIIILPAKQMDKAKILGLDLGADDYVTKPFNPLGTDLLEELVVLTFDRMQMTRAIDNIINNTVKHNLGGMEIFVSLQVQEETLILVLPPSRNRKAWFEI